MPREISPKTFYQAQRSKPSDLLDHLKIYNVNEVLSWLPKLVMWRSCPQNLLLASLRMFEIALPSMRAQASLEVGYKRALRCLRSDDAYYEITHIRQGLLRYSWGDRDGADRALKLALKTDDPKSKEITLFWLGFLQKNKKIQAVYWNQLVAEFPLTFHAYFGFAFDGQRLARHFLQ